MGQRINSGMKNNTIKEGDKTEHDDIVNGSISYWRTGRSVGYDIEDGTYIRVKRRMIQFPEPRDIYINMMPFIMGDKNSLPTEYHHYWDMIELCFTNDHHFDHFELEMGKVGYLTIHESLVEIGTSQRRPGLHTDAHLNVDNADVNYRTPTNQYRLSSKINHLYQESNLVKVGSGELMHRWGGLIGGIFVASTVDNSCVAWDAQIKKVGPLGDCEWCRDMLGNTAVPMRANTMYWITDLTPHESLPISTTSPVYRQFFRLVTSDVSLWYEEHNTHNPMGIEPGCPIVYGDKFVLK